MNLFKPKIIDRNRFNDYSQVTLTFLAVAMFIIFAIRPSLVKAYELYSDYNKYQELSELLQAKVKKLEEFEELKETKPEVFELINKALPETSDEGGLIRSLNLIATEKLVILKSVTFGKETSTIYGVNALEMSIDIEGDYEDIINFISTVANSRRIMSVESANVSLSSNGVTYLATVKVKAYFGTAPL